ncbi:MAG: hypothetical protein KF808_00170 [Cryobacterium sp.]|nr:hypothetical protein [Cryobacterium sp.]
MFVLGGDLAVLALDGDYIIEAVRDSYRVSRKPIAPAAGTPDPGTAQAIALELVLARGWDQSQYDCLAALWQKESHWNVFAMNPYSGAYGIPQALSRRQDGFRWPRLATNPRTHHLGLGYISARYVNPAERGSTPKDHNWY